MRKISTKILSVILLLATVSSNDLWAQEKVYSGMIPDANHSPVLVFDINQPALTISDPVYADPALRPLIGAVKKMQNVVLLKINEDAAAMVPSDFTADITVAVSYTLPNGTVVPPFNKTLHLDYKIGMGQKAGVASYFVADDGGYLLTVQITAIQTNVTWDVKPFLRIFSEIHSEYDAPFNPTISIPSISNAPVSTPLYDELIVNWSYPGTSSGNTFNNYPTDYDIEWAWIEELAADNYKTNGNWDPEKIFFNNATRVTVPISANSYKIPVFYDGSGRLFYRVRPLQKRIDGQIINGNWTNSLLENAGMFTIATGHEEGLNWQVSTTYAEEGKRKTVISYFDGTLRSRQTVTKDNSQDNPTTVVAETFYDYQGRPAIQVLPSPTLNNVIAFTRNFNNNASDHNGYPKEIYDMLQSGQAICSNGAPPLENTVRSNFGDGTLGANGAGNYYSSQNPLVNTSFNKFIPEANGYPFTETRYTQDATGRIAAQGGVGQAFQLGTGQETKYFYSSPTQDEIDLLFGTDAGFAGHYEKNLVQDANKQFSVSYVDMHGRTVATALAGKAPPALSPLASLTNLPVIGTDDAPKQELLNPETNVIDGRSIVLVKEFVVTAAPSLRKFKYKLDPKQLLLQNCANQDICYDCLYDLTITIKRTCDDAVIYTVTKNNFSLPYNSVCGTDPADIIENFDVNFDQTGAYTLTKTLTISREAQDQFRENAMQTGNLVCKTQLDFYNEIKEVMLAQNANCQPTCSTCTAALGGSYANFREAFRIKMQLQPADMPAYDVALTAAYEQALADCNAICEYGSDRVNNFRDIMLQDMTPDQGQYARLFEELVDNAGNPFTVNLSNREYNIFGTGSYKMPADKFGNLLDPLSYLDEYGNPDPASPDNLGSISEQDFTTVFKESWANQLLPYHPEYKKLLLVESDNMKAAYRWQEQWQEKQKWSEVSAIAVGLPGSDPFYNTVLVGSSIQGDMNAFMANAVKVRAQIGSDNFTYYGMWQFAIASVKCKSLPSGSQTACIAASSNIIGTFPPEISCDADKDMVWKVFSSLYFSAREQFIYNYLQQAAPVSPSIFNAPPAGSYFTRYQPRFINPADGLANNIPTDLQALFNDAINPDPHNDAAAIAALEAQYLDNCRSYVDRWLEQLAPFKVCNGNITDIDLKNLTDQLVSICHRGSDLDHPLGSSSISPTNSNQSVPTTFEQAISNFMATHTIAVTQSCHPYVIDWPKPYDKSPVVDNDEITETDPEQCACDRLTQLENLYSSSLFNGSFLLYLQTVHGIKITQAVLTQINDLCKTMVVPTCRYLPEPIILPPGMQCKTTTQACVSCNEYTVYKNQFIAVFSTAIPPGLALPKMYPATEQEQAWNATFTSFMNSKTGFSKQWSDYAGFEKNCIYSSEPINAPAGLCSRFNTLISGFNAIPQDPNITFEDCQDAFVSYFNEQEGSNLTYAQIKYLYNRCVGGTCTDLPINCSGNTFNLSELVINNNDAYLVTLDANGNAGTCGVLAAGSPTVTAPSVETGASPTFTVTAVAVNLPDITINAVNIVPDTTTNCSTGTSLFQKTYGGNSDETIYATAVAADNGYVMAGQTSSYGSGGTDGLLIKTNQNGIVQWSKALGGTGNDAIYKIIKTADNGFIACGQTKSFGNTAGDAWLIKTDAAGNIQWSKKYGDGNVYGEVSFDVIQTADGGYAFCGSHRFAPSHAQSYVTRTDNLGNAIWSRSYDVPSNSDGAHGLVEDGSSLVIAGYNQGAAGGSNKGSAGEDSTNLAEMGPNSYYDSYLMKLNTSNGDINFTQEYDADNRSTWFQKISKVTNGYQVHSLVMNDYIGTNQQNYIWNLATNGTVQNVRKLVIPGTTTKSYGWLAQADGGFIVANGENNSASDVIYSKINAAGTPEWNHSISIEGNQAIYSIVPTATGGYAFAGITNARTAAAPVCGEPLPTYLCGLNDPINQEFEIEPDDPCQDYLNLAANASVEAYTLYLTKIKNDFDKAYLAKCLAVQEWESLTMETPDEKEYHYTLYYYDQAGTLVQTIPPAGVDDHGNTNQLRKDFLLAVKNARAAGIAHRPVHTLPTTYRYNTLGQVVQQKSPDGGLSKFWYDELGRLVVSQNAKQVTNNEYSYTMYDGLGRITQVGQKVKNIPMTQAISRKPIGPNSLDDWLSAGAAKTQITRTVYDIQYENNNLPVLDPRLLVQRNLRNRVSYTQVVNTEPANPTIADSWVQAHATATYYTYDIHGNVDELVQDYNEGPMKTLASGANRFKKIAYSYDLISGKVNTVIYQPDYYNANNVLTHHVDRFYHRYDYDAENKLTAAETSHDGIIWETDARYTYYKHGPLARTVLGQQQVQGIDYAYTLQGWLKGVNSTAISATPSEDCAPGTGREVLDVSYRQQYGHPSNYVARREINFDPEFESDMPDDFTAEPNINLQPCIPVIAPTPYITGDMGKDGDNISLANPNKWTARDAYSFSLNYYQTDYQSINTTQQPFTNVGMFNLTNLESNTVGKPLFNGNIASMFVNIPKLGDAHLYAYQYDQLNRIVSMDAFKGFDPANNTWIGGQPATTPNYKERVSYDPNGNILTYYRNGSTTPPANGGGGGGQQQMDQLTYGYNTSAGKLVNNRLRHVKDAIGDGNYIEDVDDQDDDNYKYDEIGNLVIDKKEGLYDPLDPNRPMIEWNVYGKISSITKVKNNETTYIYYTYDASGNRISKKVEPGSGFIVKPVITTIYVRDASGNVMSIYKSETDNGQTTDPNSATLVQEEVHLYGSSRLGIYTTGINVKNPVANTTGMYLFERGHKVFELSNHLGNVLVTITDRKLQVDSDGNGQIDYYAADVVTAVDGYSGGMEMPGRKFEIAGNTYRYSINGQEKTPEVGANTTTAEFWQYDARIVRRWNVDPVLKEYESSYLAFGGNPILKSDPDGDCAHGGGGDCPHCGRNHNPGGGGSMMGDIENWLYGIKVDLTCGRRWNEAVTNVNRSINPLYNAAALTVGEENLDIPSHMQPMSRTDAAFNLTTQWMWWKYLKIAAEANPMAQMERQLGSVPSGSRPPSQGTVLELANEEKNIATTSFRITSGMSRTVKADIRKAFAQNYFEISGRSPNSVRTLMQTIDFSKKVKETVLNIGDKVYRFERTKGVIEPEKHFYTNAYGADGGATAVGFAESSGYKLVTYEVTKRTTVMESTIRGTKTTQYFSVQLQNVIKKISEE